MRKNGQFPVIIGSETLVLHAKLDAAERIDQLLGGIGVAEIQVIRGNVDGVAKVIMAGTCEGGVIDEMRLKSLKQAIWEHGTGLVAKQVVPYIKKMLNPSADEGNEKSPDQSPVESQEAVH